MTNNTVPITENFGTVHTVRDGVAILNGLSKAKMSEQVVSEDGSISGMIMNLDTDTVGVVLFGDYTKVHQGQRFFSTGEVMSVPASEEMLGRVVNALGEPIDGLPFIQESFEHMPVEKIAPGVMSREPVSQPLQTGIMAIDSMIPIGRGQRELIIGDRSTGKTAIAIDTIINQKQAGEEMICIYVAIGQKQSRVAQLTEKLDQ